MINKIRVLIPDFSNSDWTAGSVYLNNLKSAVNEYIPEIDVTILKIQQIKKSINIFTPVLKIINELLNRIYGYDKELDKQLKNNYNGNFDCIYMPGFKLLKQGTANISWIPDFQHLHLKSMFSKYEIFARNYTTKLSAKKSTLVVLSSYDAEKDFHRLLPEFKSKTRVMQFVADVPSHIFDTNPAEVITIYNLPDKFFYLPNQFWMHKNHIIVWKALEILKKRNQKVLVVCTGNTKDYRNRNFFEDLIKKVSLFDINDQIKILGLLPHDHVYQLIRQSVSVINPSLFEGWSTTVEETKSIGKRMILSDINVHTEQNPPGAIYFNPHDANSLADAFQKNWVLNPGPDSDMESEARINLKSRKKEFAEKFHSIIREAIESKK